MRATLTRWHEYSKHQILRNVATKRNKAAQRGMDAYEQAARTKGHINADGSFGGVDLDDWREAFRALGDEDETAKVMRTLFSRAKKQLIENGEIRAENLRFYLAGDLAEMRQNLFVTDLRARKDI